jgi:hypothetical protein
MGVAIIWAQPMKLAVGVDPMEAQLGLFGDSFNLNAR